MTALLLCGIVMAYIIGNLHGQKRGWDDGIKVARIWEGFSRDWHMAYEMEIADTEHERERIREVRQLRKMYDGV